MKEIQQHEEELGSTAGAPVSANGDELFPSHYFDYMYGTSTGG